MTTQREAFEAWARGENLSLVPHMCTPKKYLSYCTEKAWQSYQAAQAAMPVDPDAVRFQYMRVRSILCGVSSAEWSKKEAELDAEIARNAEATP